MLWRNRFFNNIGRSRRCARLSKKWAAKNAKERCKCGQSTNLGAFRSKIRCYLEVLTKLREFVQRKRPELWPDKWILHHDIAPAHDVLRVCEFLAKKSIKEKHYRLFPKLKNDMKGQRFADSWNPKQRENNTGRYSEKQFSRLLMAQSA
jgi:hypothetical protein